MMGKIVSLLILLMICSIVIAGDYDSVTGKTTVTLNKGWNIIPIMYTFEPNDCYSSANWGYFYSGLSKQYIGYSINPSGNYYPDKLTYDQMIANEASTNKYYYALYQFGSLWVQSNKDCTFKTSFFTYDDIHTQESSIKNMISEAKLVSGWNFLNTNPWMVGKNLKDIFSKCTVTGFNSWISNSQTWEFQSSSSAASQLVQSTGVIRDADVGKTFVIKVANDCYLNYGSGSSPPALPGDTYVVDYNIPENTARKVWKSAVPFGITDWTKEGETVYLNLVNNSETNLTLTGVQLSDTMYFWPNEVLTPGAQTIVKIPSTSCTTGQSFAYSKSNILFTYISTTDMNRTQAATSDLIGTCN